MSKQTIILASDHAGFKLKEVIKSFLLEKGFLIDDVGAHELKDGDDYPVYMASASVKVAQGSPEDVKAIIFGGSGQGEAMVANRFPGVRADVWYGGGMEILKRSREDNNANVLSIGARFVGEDDAKKAIEIWLDTAFSNEERHKRRIEQMDRIE